MIARVQSTRELRGTIRARQSLERLFSDLCWWRYVKPVFRKSIFWPWPASGTASEILFWPVFGEGIFRPLLACIRGRYANSFSYIQFSEFVSIDLQVYDRARSIHATKKQNTSACVDGCTDSAQSLHGSRLYLSCSYNSSQMFSTNVFRSCRESKLASVVCVSFDHWLPRRKVLKLKQRIKNKRAL